MENLCATDSLQNGHHALMKGHAVSSQGVKGKKNGRC